MARPDPALLDPARYPVRFTTTTRYQDMDPNLHINNVAAAAMMEDARARFSYSLGMDTALAGRDRRAVVAAVSLDYIDELFYPDPVTALIGVLGLGRTSWRVGGLLVQEQRVGVFMTSTIVLTEDGRPAPLPEAFRTRLGENLIRLPAPLA